MAVRRTPLRWALAALVVVGFAPPRAAQAELLSIGGHVKAFGIGSVPYASRLMAQGPTGSAVVDARLKLAFQPHEHLSFSFDPTLTASLGGGTGLNTGVGLTAPELLPLTAQIVQAGTLSLRFRVDRALVRAELGPVRITAGRQPVTFGEGLLFTPMDLVAPFNPAVLDQSYKPGLDAFRADLFLGMAGQISLVAAYVGATSLADVPAPGEEPDEELGLDAFTLAAHGKGTLGTVDLAGFVGAVYGDFVGGASVYAPVGPIGLYGDVTVTVVRERAFPRAVVGVSFRPTSTTSITAEVYAQRFGTTDTRSYLAFQQTDRFLRGELWLAGHLYAGVSLSQEITPLVRASALVLANLLDPSALLMGSVGWSVAANADFAAGVQLGVGERPDEEVPNPLYSGRSEFGIVPVIGFVQVGVYF